MEGGGAAEGTSNPAALMSSMGECFLAVVGRCDPELRDVYPARRFFNPMRVNCRFGCVHPSRLRRGKMRQATAHPSHARTVFILLTVLAAAPATAWADTVRGPDAHVLARPRGDVLTDHRTPIIKQVRSQPAYVAPYPGWTYTRLRAGQRLRPGFWRPAYVIAPHDLPPPGKDRRWIRYGDDRVLVNVRDGRVLRVIGNVPSKPKP